MRKGGYASCKPVSQGNGYDALVENGNLTMPNGQMGVWDYFIRDYQQNVRMILTEETHQSSSTATMETARAITEDAVFGQTGGGNEVEATRTNTPPGWSGNTSGSVSRLGNITGHNLGPNTLQKVMAGDQLSAVVQYYHQANGTNSGSNIVSNVVSNLLLALSSGNTSSVLVRENAPAITSQLNGTPGFINVVQPQNTAGNPPQAYLTILFFDERFNFIAASDGGAVQQQVAASVSASGAQLVLANIKAPKNGYAYVYVSNQSDQDVYFDNLQVGVTAGNIIEEDHYYAYGLKIAGISSKKLGDSFEGLLKNNNLYNDKELFDDGDLNWYDYGFRNYDPQTGRFVQIDPLADDYGDLTPYHYAANDPIGNVDQDGLSPISILGQVACWSGQSASMVNMLNALQSVGHVVGLVADFANMAGNVANIVNDATLLDKINGKAAAQGVGDQSQLQGGKLNEQDPPEKTIKEIFGKSLYDLDEEELKSIEDPDRREIFLGGKYTIKLTVWERLYMAGYYAGFVIPTAKAPRVIKFLANKEIPLKINEGMLNVEQRSLQHMFSRHAKDFGVTGNWNKTIAEDFERILRKHMRGLMPIRGTYRGTQQALHYFNPSTGLNVMTDMSGNLLGGWKLSTDQIKYLLSTGTIK